MYGRVVGVSNGDTITVLDAEQVTRKIRLSAFPPFRLSGIAAPEKAQPFGERAKQQLSDWVYHATVRVILRNNYA